MTDTPAQAYGKALAAQSAARTAAEQGGPDRPDPQLTEIVGKYRALVTAMRRFDQLRREVAELYVGLSEAQKTTYGEIVERIEIEDREGS